MNLDDRITIGKEAQRLLVDPLFNGVINVLLKESMVVLGSTDVGTPAATNAHAQIRALEKIKEQLKVLENDAVMAKREVEKGAR